MNKEVKKALVILDEETGGKASQWYEFRSYEGLKHIINYETGKWISPFEGASGTLYYIRSPLEGIGPKRYTELMKRMPAIGFDSTFAKLMEYTSQATEAANSIGSTKPRLSDLFTCLTNMSEGIRRNDRDWQMSFVVASLFIVRKDEDLTAWSFDDAKEKIEDWNKSQIHEQDFFFLVMYWQALSSNWYGSLPDKINRLVLEWTPLI